MKVPMVYLLLNMVFSSAFTLCIKWVQVRHREDIISVGAINYITAAVLIAPRFASNAGGGGGIESWAVITGCWMGACYFVAFFFVIHAIRWVGAASATVISVLSLLLPIGFAAMWWQEMPSQYQTIGIGLALVSLLLIGAQRPDAASAARPWFTPIVLVTFFLLAGFSRLAQKTFGHVSLPQHMPTFLFAAFATAAVPSVVLLFCRARRLRPSEVLFGVALGTANVLQTHFILKSLDVFPGYIVFPAVSAGGLILTTLVATRWLGERLTRRTYAGIGLAVVAMVLLNR